MEQELRDMLDESVKGKKQELSEIDRHLYALVKADVPMIVGWDVEKHIFIVVGIDRAEDVEPDCIPFDQDDWLVYEVSDGFPGDRSSSESYFSFDEAQTAFTSACERGKL